MAVPPELLKHATRSLAHRGPDDQGTVILHVNFAEPVEIDRATAGWRSMVAFREAAACANRTAS